MLNIKWNTTMQLNNIVGPRSRKRVLGKLWWAFPSRLIAQAFPFQVCLTQNAHKDPLFFTSECTFMGECMGVQIKLS